MSYLEVFGVLTGVGVDVSKFFGVGAGVLEPEAVAESESEEYDSAHLRSVQCKLFTSSCPHFADL